MITKIVSLKKEGEQVENQEQKEMVQENVETVEVVASENQEVETQEQPEQQKPSKQVWIILGVLAIAILIVGYIFLTQEKKENNNQNADQKFKEKTGYDERLKKTIQNEFIVNNKGTIYRGYKFNKEYYLTLNQSGTFEYTKELPGDILIWAKEVNGKVETKELTNGDKLIKVIENKEGSPYFEQDGKTYFIYYEREGNEKVGYAANGYVYEVSKDGKIKEQYKTKGNFAGLQKDENGSLLMIEKVYTDSYNSYPTELKPYKLKTYRLENNKWNFLKEQIVKPMEEMEKKQSTKK